MIIRKAQSEDLLAISALDYTLRDISAWNLQQFEDAYNQQSLNYVVEGKTPKIILGYVFTQYVLDEAEIHIIAIHRSIQRKGIARKLLLFLTAKLEEKGVKRLFLEVSESNNAALHLYKSFGFEAVGRRKNYYKKFVISDKGENFIFEDAIVMEKSLV